MPETELERRVQAPSAVRYIKLGLGGAWAADAIEQSIVPFGFSQVAHEPCAVGDWDSVSRQLVASGRNPGGATSGVREALGTRAA